MKYLGKGSVSSFLQVILKITWWATLVGTGLLMVSIVVGLINPEGLIHLGGKFQAELANLRLYMDSADITTDQAQLILLSSLIALIPMVAMTLLTIYHLRKVVHSLVDGNPFIKDNVASVRVIGFTVVIWALVQPLVEGVIGLLLMGNLAIPGVNVQLSVDGNFTNIFFGLVILVLSEVFRIGVHLKEDQDLTI